MLPPPLYFSWKCRTMLLYFQLLPLFSNPDIRVFWPSEMYAHLQWRLDPYIWFTFILQLRSTGLWSPPPWLTVISSIIWVQSSVWLYLCNVEQQKSIPIIHVCNIFSAAFFRAWTDFALGGHGLVYAHLCNWEIDKSRTK